MRCADALQACLHGKSSYAENCRDGWPASLARLLGVPTLQIQSAWQPLCCCLVADPKRALSAPLTGTRLESRSASKGLNLGLCFSDMRHPPLHQQYQHHTTPHHAIRTETTLKDKVPSYNHNCHSGPRLPYIGPSLSNASLFPYQVVWAALLTTFNSARSLITFMRVL